MSPSSLHVFHILNMIKSSPNYYRWAEGIFLLLFIGDIHISNYEMNKKRGKVSE